MTALLHEYTRLSATFRRAVERWHLQPFDLDDLATFDHLYEDEPLHTALGVTAGIANAQAVELAYNLDLRGTAPDAVTILVTSFRLAAPPSLFVTSDRSVAVRFSSLDKPWSEFQRMYGDAGLKPRLIAVPAGSGGIMTDLGPRHAYEHLFNLEPGLRREEWLIDWSRPVEELVQVFRYRQRKTGCRTLRRCRQTRTNSDVGAIKMVGSISLPPGWL